MTKLEQRSLNTRPTNKLPTMPSEYVLFCGLHFIKMSNDKDILPPNTKEQERERWLSSSFRLWAPDFVHNRRMLKTVHNFLFYVPKKGGDKTAHQSNMACTISTTSTIYNYLLLSTLPIPVRPGERSAKRRSGSSSTSSSGWSRWQLCYNATMVPNNYVIVPTCIFMKWVLHFLKTSELHILFYSLLLSGVKAISAFCKEQQQCIAMVNWDYSRLASLAFDKKISCNLLNLNILFLRHEQR